MFTHFLVVLMYFPLFLLGLLFVFPSSVTSSLRRRSRYTAHTRKFHTRDKFRKQSAKALSKHTTSITHYHSFHLSIIHSEVFFSFFLTFCLLLLFHPLTHCSDSSYTVKEICISYRSLQTSSLISITQEDQDLEAVQTSFARPQTWKPASCRRV